MNELQKKLGYHFRDKDLLEQALTHQTCSTTRNNERFEFLGDALLNFVVAEMLFTTFASHSEGKMSRTRAALVNASALTTIGKAIGVDKHLRHGPLDRRSRKEGMVADCMEALLAAVYLEAGMETATRIIVGMADRLLQESSVRLEKDPKSLLQERLQARKLPVPEYVMLSKTGGHIRVSCNIPALKVSVEAEGGTRKQAETSAAEKALALIGA